MFVANTMVPGMAKIREPVGGHSSVERLLKVDGRTRTGKLMRDIRLALVDHVGGHANAAQQILIHAATIKIMRCILIERRVLSEQSLAEGDKHQYLAWSNSLRRDLEALGIMGSKGVAPDLHTYIEAAE